MKVERRAAATQENKDHVTTLKTVYQTWGIQFKTDTIKWHENI